MDFFGAQDAARRRTAGLVVLFALAAAGLVTVTSLLLSLVLGLSGTGPAANLEGNPTAFDWLAFGAIAAVVALVVAAGSLYKILVLSRGGGAVAEALGGRLIAPDTEDPDSRRVLNLVEEIAIASGTVVPSVYLLGEEAGINAFAAGLTPANAVIGLTQGAVAGLSRDQLQGVIAHEFSHILNGDMRLNIRLAGLLHGILLIGLIGRGLVQAGGRGGGRRGRDRAGLMVVGLGLMATGFTGTLFANLIKASVSRQREFLADASAVQFTRNPQGIAGALKRIGAVSTHGLLSHPRAPEMSHAYFAQGIRSLLGRLSATHPPLETRIRRLEPSWKGRFEEALEAGKPVAEDQAPAVASGLASSAGDLAAGTASDLVQATQAAIDQIGRPDEAHLRYAHSLIGDLPAALRWAAREPYGAQTLVFALLLDPDTAIRQRQLALLETGIDAGLGAETSLLFPAVLATRREQRLPLLDLSLPALRQLSVPQLQGFKAAMEALIGADGRVRLFEWCLSRILISGLDPDFGNSQRGVTGQRDCADLAAECTLVLSLLARIQDDGDAARMAFTAASKVISMAIPQPMEGGLIDHHALDQALERLVGLKPQAKHQLLQACAAAILADDKVTPAELEVVRAIGAVLDCPIPPLRIQGRLGP